MIVSGELVTETAERVLAKLDDDDALVEVLDVMVIAVVRYNMTEESETSSLFYRCTSALSYRQVGLLEEARRAVDANREEPD